MTETVLVPLFSTYTFVPTRTESWGLSPTGIVALTVFVFVSTTETVLLNWLEV
jgi:hypothetical protein